MDQKYFRYKVKSTLLIPLKKLLEISHTYQAASIRN